MTEPTLSDALDDALSACMVLANHLAPFEAEEAAAIGEPGAEYLRTIAWRWARAAYDATGPLIERLPREGCEDVVDLYVLLDVGMDVLSSADCAIQASAVRGCRRLLIRAVDRASAAMPGASDG